MQTDFFDKMFFLKYQTKNHLRYLYALLAIPIVILTRFALLPLAHQGTPFITLFPATVIIALLGGMGPAILTGVIGVLLSDYFFIEPLHSWEIGIAFWTRTSVVVSTSVFVGYVGAVLREARVRAENQAIELNRNRQDLKRAQAVAHTGSWRLDTRNNKLTWSDEAYRIFGVPFDTPLTYESFLSYIHPEDREYVNQKWEAALKGDTYDIEHRIVVDKQMKWVHEKAELEYENGNTLTGGFGTVTDITEQKKKEEELHRLNRTLRALSKSTQTIAHTEDEVTYLQNVCDIIINDCGHAMVWIGFAENDDAKTVRPVACSGFEEGYLDTLKITWADTERGRGPTGTAIRTGKPSICKNIPTNPAFEPWREDAIKRGYASSISLPLLNDGKAFGALTIYSRQADPFTKDEVILLTELAGDLSLGISTIRLRKARDEAEESLRESEKNYRELVQNANSAIIRWNRDGNVTLFNEYAQQFFGYSSDEVIGRKVNFLLPNGNTTETDASELIHNILHDPNNYASIVNENICRDGRRVWMAWTNKPIYDGNGQVSEILAVGTDITKRREMEEELRKSRDKLEIRVRERTLELQETNEQLKEEIEERLRTEQFLRWEEARLDALVSLSEISEAPLDKITNFTLEQAIALTHSKIGFLGFLNEDETMYELHSVSKDVVRECNVEGDPIHWPVADAGIWADAIRQRKTLFVNDYSQPHPRKKGIPKGHVPMERLMVVPIFEGEKIVTIAGVGNKDSDYEKTDERQVVLLLSAMWNYVQKKHSRELALAERQRFNDVLETLPVYVCLLTPDYYMPFANKVFRDLFGYYPDKKCYEFLFDRKEPCENCETYKVLETKQPQHWEWTGPNDRNYDIFDFPFRDTDGSQLILEMGIDITERKKAQEELRSASLYSRSLLEASLDPLVTISAEGKITDVNEATAQVTGISRMELIGTDFSNYFTEPDKAREGYQKVFAEGFVTDYPLTIQNHNGKLTDVLYNATVYKNEEGKVQGIFAAARDVTEKKQTERRQGVTNSLLELYARKTSRKEYLNSAVDVIRDWSGCSKVGIRIKDVEGNIPYESSVGFEEHFIEVENPLHLGSDSCLCIRAILQKPNESDKGLLTPGGSFYSNDSLEFLANLSSVQARNYRGQCMKHGFQSIGIIPIRYRDDVVGAIHIADSQKDMVPLANIQFIESTISPLIGEAINRFNAEAELEQYRLHLEELVKQRTEELARSNKDLEQFAYVASHDLQEPLRAVSGFVSLLERQLQDSLHDKTKEYMDFAVDGTHRMQALINGLLEYSRIDTRGKPPVKIDSSEPLEDAILSLHTSIGESGAKVTSDKLPIVHIDPVQLTQLFQNLISNAIKFRSEKPPEIHVSATRQDSAWQFSVKDNGIGIEPQYAERIFMIFQRLHTRKQYPGTGIGLSLCKKIVERHGGKIWMESEPGKGSTFYFTIPDLEGQN